MFEEYQETLILDFFSKVPGVSPAVCHQVITELLSPCSVAKVEPVQFQGSLSYTCVVDTSASQRKIIQFRHEEFDTSSTDKAHSIYGDIVPPLRYLGHHHQLHIYSSPFRTGCPYVEFLQAAEGVPLAGHRIQTVTDMSFLFVGGLYFHGSQPTARDTRSAVLHLRPTTATLACEARCKVLLENTLTVIESNSNLVDALPTVLAHGDLTPFNYLVERTSGRITAVLDWDGATVQRVGYNLHFAEHLFGSMTLDGWEDYPEREAIEGKFCSTLCEHLSAQGIDGVSAFLFSMELSKALGILEYYVPRVANGAVDVWEKFLVAFLQRLSWENAQA